MKLFLLTISTIFFWPVANSHAQTTTRYKDRIFEETKVIKDVQYSTEQPDGVKPKRNRLDIYVPENDTATRRPLIIWIHGGGFRFGNKSARGIPLWCRDFAKRGYVCAAVNYRFSRKNTWSDFTELAKACYYAIEDMRKAVSYLKANSALYGIDSNYIILAGNSAGGMVALQAAYASKSELGKIARISVPDADSVTHNSLGISAVVNYWGAIYDTTWLHNASVPIVSVHGRKDRIVPYDHKKASIYGSYAIHVRADSLGIPNSLHTFDKVAHELQKNFNPFWAGSAAKKRWREAGDFTAEFLYRQVFHAKDFTQSAQRSKGRNENKR